MLQGFNTEKVKYAYLGIIALSLICVAAFCLTLYNLTVSQANTARALQHSKELLYQTRHAISFLNMVGNSSSSRMYAASRSELSKSVHQLTLLKSSHVSARTLKDFPAQKATFDAVENLIREGNIVVQQERRTLEKATVTQALDTASLVINALQSNIESFVIAQNALTFRNNSLYFLIIATFFILIGVQGTLIFRPGYEELKKNASKVLKAKRALNYAATHDPITDLLNRREGEKVLSLAITDATEKNRMVGLFHIDIDDFKVINEKMGHSAGDNMLHQAAQRLKRTFRKTDTVARMGGDEFLVIIPNLDCLETLTNLAEKLLDIFEVPFQVLSDQSMSVHASIGMACYPDDGHSPQELMVASDMALSKAKEKGKKRYTRFNDSMKSDFNKKMAICDRINTALEMREFEVFYHPQIHIETGAITGIEAPVRGRDPELGQRSPGSFIDTIEAAGFMSRLGSYILDQAIRDAHYWFRNDINFGRVALNMSAVQLNDIDLVNQLLESLMKYRLPPRYLSIEILENVVITGQEHRFKQLIDELNDLDIHVELDDFGTGHASLYNLKQFSINRIKLDCEFISEIETNERQKSIVEGLVRIINNIGLETIAEGVETVEQAEMLHSWGCCHAQGFLYTKPLPFDQMTNYLKMANYKRSLPTLGSMRPYDKVCQEGIEQEENLRKLGA